MPKFGEETPAMASSVNAAGRLDRLPMGAFQWRILSLVGLGIFFDGFDNQMAAGVLGALVKEGWSTMEMNAHYISITLPASPLVP
jgi:putative MFS transporter